MLVALKPVGFNPRPPLLAGDATRSRRQRRPQTFQSAPAIAGGRCSATDRWRTPGRTFQSAPAIAGGRCARPARQWAGPWPGFNPRPPLLAGDAQARGALGAAKEVSIRARHCWRAMPGQRPCAAFPARFQSAPAIAGGRCMDQCDRATMEIVSIRARHCWRAMQVRLPGYVLVASQFQSAPAIAGGRCEDARRFCIDGVAVSIRARHCWRAMLAPLDDAHSLGLVSIRARHCWRAMPYAG